MKRFTFILIFTAIFLIFSYSPLSNSQTQEKYILDIFSQADCTTNPDYELAGTFIRADGATETFCIQTSQQYEPTETYLTNAYLSIGEMCTTKSYNYFTIYQNQERFNNNDLSPSYICKQFSSTPKKTEIIQDIKILEGDCPLGYITSQSFIDGNGIETKLCVKGKSEEVPPEEKPITTRRETINCEIYLTQVECRKEGCQVVQCADNDLTCKIIEKEEDQETVPGCVPSQKTVIVEKRYKCVPDTCCHKNDSDITFVASEFYNLGSTLATGQDFQCWFAEKAEPIDSLTLPLNPAIPQQEQIGICSSNKILNYEEDSEKDLVLLAGDALPDNGGTTPPPSQYFPGGGDYGTELCNFCPYETEIQCSTGLHIPTQARIFPYLNSDFAIEFQGQDIVKVTKRQEYGSVCSDSLNLPIKQIFETIKNDMDFRDYQDSANSVLNWLETCGTTKPTIVITSCGETYARNIESEAVARTACENAAVECGLTEDCINNIDDDNDGLIDCEDPDCASDFSCPICGNTQLNTMQGEECEFLTDGSLIFIEGINLCSDLSSNFAPTPLDPKNCIRPEQIIEGEWYDNQGRTACRIDTSSCEEATLCSEGDICSFVDGSEGICQSNGKCFKSCDDNNPCTNEKLDYINGCVSLGILQDGMFCTAVIGVWNEKKFGSCQSGMCIPFDNPYCRDISCGEWCEQNDIELKKLIECAEKKKFNGFFGQTPCLKNIDAIHCLGIGGQGMYNPLNQKIIFCDEKFSIKKLACRDLRHETIHSIVMCGDACSIPNIGYLPSTPPDVNPDSCCFKRIAHELTAYLCSKDCDNIFDCANKVEDSIEYTPDSFLLNCPSGWQFRGTVNKYSSWYEDWWAHNGPNAVDGGVCKKIEDECDSILSS